MVLVLAHVFAETDHLGRSGLASDVEAGDFYSRTSAAVVDDPPHSIDYNLVLIFRDGNDLRIWPLGIQRLEHAQWPIVGIALLSDRLQLLQQVRNVEFSADPNPGDLSQRRDGRDDVIDLAERRIDSVDVAPFRIASEYESVFLPLNAILPFV